MLVYVTCKDVKEAEKISRHLLEKKLIACANYFPVKSMYWWDNQIVDDSEFVLIVKCVNFEKVKKEVKKVHSYKIPCILKIDAVGNEEYMNWVQSVCK